MVVRQDQPVIVDDDTTAERTVVGIDPHDGLFDSLDDLDQVGGMGPQGKSRGECSDQWDCGAALRWQREMHDSSLRREPL